MARSGSVYLRACFAAPLQGRRTQALDVGTLCSVLTSNLWSGYNDL